MEEQKKTPSPETKATTEAVRELKRAIHRSRHALFQLRRYRTSPGAVVYQEKSKQDLAQAYARLGALLAEEHLL